MKLKPVLLFGSGMMAGVLLGAAYVIRSYSTFVLPAVERYSQLQLVDSSLMYANLVDQNYDLQQLRSHAMSRANDGLASIDASGPLPECPLALAKISIAGTPCDSLSSFVQASDIHTREFFSEIDERTPPSFMERMDQAAREDP